MPLYDGPVDTVAVRRRKLTPGCLRVNFDKRYWRPRPAFRLCLGYLCVFALEGCVGLLQGRRHVLQASGYPLNLCFVWRCCRILEQQSGSVGAPHLHLDLQVLHERCCLPANAFFDAPEQE